MQIHTHNKGCQIDVSTDRFSSQIREAQKKLNMLVLADSTPYVPFSQGMLRSQTRFPNGIYGEWLEWYAPYAHYQYYGELYLTTDGRSWAKKGEIKVPAGVPLKYHEPNTGDHWFDKAKRTHGREWASVVRRIGGGG